MAIKDLTKEQLVTALGGPSDGSSLIDQEAAIYWFAADYHSGQWSSLYRILCESDYKPSPIERGVQEVGGEAGEMYEKLVKLFG
jgi:hypothetical protein